MWALLGALVVLGGCASSGSVKKLGEDARLTHTMVLQLGQVTEDLRRELGQVRGQLAGLREDLQATAKAEDARRQELIEGLQRRLDATDTRVETLAGALRGVEMSVGGLADQVARLEALPSAAAKPRREPRATRAAARAAAPEEMFERAFESFKGGELGQAILDFEDFLAKHPSHALAGAARFWIGEAYFAARDYQHAAGEYRKAVDIAPKGEKTPEALLKMGLAYRALRRHDRAREAWTQVVREFPQSDAAQKARVALREAGAGRSGESAEP